MSTNKINALPPLPHRAALVASPSEDDTDPTPKDQYRRMFQAACTDLAAISEALGLDPNAGGAVPILDAIEQLRAAWPADSAALRDVVTAAQNLDENSEELELDDGAGRAAGLRYWHALDDALENLAEALAKPRTCNNEACGWTGTTRRMLGAVGPLCPECGETTEEVDGAAARATKGA